MNNPSPTKRCKRWGPPCPFCAQSALHPSPVESDWSEEDWDGEIQKKKREKKRKEEEMRQRQEEKRKILDSDSKYVSNYEEKTPTLVSYLVLAPEDFRDTQQDINDNQTEEDS